MKSLSDRLYFLVAPPNLGGEKVTRALLFMPLLFFASLPCHAETQVSGLITNATWTATNSPYRVIGNIQVSGLMIQPGVQIIFQSNYVFAVNGILTASGTAANPIVFMGTNGGWQGIYFSNSAPGSVLAYCTVSNSVNSGIRILNTSPAINNCLITLNSSGSSIYGGGIYASIAAGDLTISNTTIANNTVPNVNPYKVSYGGGIYAAVNTNSLNLSGCIVTNNRANANYGYGWAYGGGVFVSGNGKFNSCLIRGNSCTARTEYNVTGGAAWGGGIFAQGGKFSLNNCLLELNTSSSPDTGVGDEYAYGGALYIQGGSSVVMSNCIVAGNVDSAPNGSAGGGICVAGGLFDHTGQYAPGGGSLNLVNCTIAYNNLEGLAIASGSTATVVNSIIYTNAAGGTQIAGVSGSMGTANVSYCDVQGGFTGVGNINLNPLFASATNFSIVLGSPCIDAGNPNPAFNDVCLPPSLGTITNDMGANGGPGACNWTAPSRPTINIQPTNVTVIAGGNTSFSVTASGIGTLAYQWFFNQTIPIAGATNESLVLTNVSTSQAGFYAVLVSNPVGSITSAIVSLTVETILDCSALTNRTLLLRDSPYLLTCDLEVQDLSIEPGVRIEATGNFQISVLGGLRAIGTENQQIIFTTTSESTKWQGLYFNGSTGDSELIYCLVENSVNSGIRINEASPLLRQCEVRRNQAVNGAGIRISGSVPVTLEDCTIYENTYAGNNPTGGGIHTSSRLTLIRCEVRDNAISDSRGCFGSGNATTYGGGIYSTDDLVLEDVKVQGNTASARGGAETSAGGGVYTSGRLFARNCIFANNSADAGGCNIGGGARGYGGGIYCNSTLGLTNCIIANNSTRISNGNGGGIYAGDGAIVNCTVAQNNMPGGVYFGGTIVNSILWGNSSYQFAGGASVTYSCVQGIAAGNANISADPLLPPYDPAAPENVRIPCDSSPCVDAGDPAPEYEDASGPLCSSCGTSRNDMGANGGPGACKSSPTRPIVTWTNPSPIIYGTPLGFNQLNATANVPGTFAYNPTNGTVLSVGTNTLSVIFIPTDTVNYSSVTASVSLVVFSQSFLTNGLVAYYPLHGNANDASGNGNDGVVVNAVPATDRFGGINGCYSFNGNAQYIYAAADKLPSGPRTVSLWFNANEVGSRPQFLGYGGSSCGDSFFMGLNSAGQGGFVVSTHCDVYSLIVPYNTPPTNAWHHWVVVMDGVGMSFYLNGQVIGSRTETTTTHVAGTQLGLGVISSPWGSVPYTDGNVGYLDGYLDDIRIYNRALSSSEIQALYNIESQPGLVLINGSFESPAIAANTYSDTIPAGWDAAPSIALLHNGNSGDSSTWPLAQDGSQYAGIGQGPGYFLAQTFTNYSAGEYLLSWSDNTGTRGTAPPASPYAMTVVDSQLQTVISNQFDAYNAPDAYHPGLWQRRSVATFLQQGTFTLKFSTLGQPGWVDVLVDNVALSQEFAPQITGQPTNQSVPIGTTAVFSVTIAGTPPLSYRWQFNGNNLTDNLRISGSSSNTLTITNLTASDAGNYLVVVTNPYGSITSAVAHLTVSSTFTSVVSSIDSRRTYLRTSQDPNALDSIPLSLASLGIQPGDDILLEQLGTYQCSPDANCQFSQMVGVFSSNNILLNASSQFRVSGAVAAGSNFVTYNTYYNNLSTDIPQDFQITSNIVRVPLGAMFLFVAGNDSFYGDNSDPDGDFTVRITKVATADTAAPVTMLTTVSATVCSLPYAFSWSGADNVTLTANLLYAYQLDNQTWSAFDSATSLVVTQLANGPHSFTVRAKDAAGNIDPNPPVVSFRMDTASPVISGLAASPSADYCVISWVSDKPTTASINYGLTTNYGQTASAGLLVTNHSLTLFSLQPNTLYHFRVSAQDECGHQANSGDLQFATPRAPDLQVLSVSIPQEAWTEREFDVIWIVTNAGLSVASGPWVDRVYLSATSELNTNEDQLLGEFPFAGHLDPGQSVQLVQTVKVNRGDVAADYYYISVFTDATNHVYEGLGESNNVGISVSNIAVHITPLPDLIVASVEAPTDGLGGQPVEVRWVVCNQGAADTDVPVWFDHAYLSPTTDIADAIADFGEVENPLYLSPGDCYEQFASVTLPIGVEGPHFFIIRANARGAFSEESRDNNDATTIIPINIQLVRPGFLHVESVQVAPSPPTTVWAGGVVTVTWTVRNTGESTISNGAYGGWDDEVTLSPTPTYDFINGYWDVIHHIWFYGSLAPGQSYTHSEQFSVPLGINAANWYAVPIVDTHFLAGGSGIGTGNIERDQNSALVQVALPPPCDLEVTAVSSQTNGVAGQPINVRWTIANNGNNQTSGGYWYEAIYLSTNSAFSATQSRLIGTFGHWGVLDLTSNYTQNVSVTIPADLFATNILVSTQYLFVVADAGNAIIELDKTNNVLGATNALSVQQARPVLLADLAVTSVAAPWTAIAGSQVNISWAVTNHGPGATSTDSWVDSVYLSPSAKLNLASAWLLGNLPHSGIVASNGFYSQSQTFNLPYCATGSNYVIVLVDSAQVNEGGLLSHNVRASDPALHIWPGNYARLEVSAVNSPTNVLAGNALSVSWTVGNLGRVTATAPWIDALYLSATPQFIPTNSYLLGRYTNGPNLGPGGSYIGVLSGNVPRCFSGPYYVAVVTDISNVVNGISCDTNNWRVSGLPVAVSPNGYASLRVAGIALPAAVNSGSPWNVQWTVTNAGPSTASGSWSDAIYASLSPTLDAGALFLGRFDSTSGLASGASYTRTQAVAFPACWSGNYYIYVTADVSNSVNSAACQVNSQTNSSTVMVNVGAHPDLAVSSIEIPSTAYAGQSLPISWTVTNAGSVTANGPWFDSVYLSPTGGLSTSVFLGSYPYNGALASGSTYNQSTTFTLPNTTHGNFNVYVVADSSNAVNECQGEANNVTGSSSVLSVPVTLYPDLKVVAVQVPGSACAGQIINISWMVQNQGTDSTPDSTVWNDAVFLSKDQVLDPRDTRLGTFARVKSLAVGESYTNAATVQIPGGYAGPYYILVVADSGGALFQYLGYNASLGRNSTAMIVSLPPTADLAATNVTITPTAAVPGQPMTIGWSVRNVSSNSIPASWTDAAYLSTNSFWDISAVQVVRHDHSGLAASDGYSDSWTGPLPALTPGTYHALVRTDVRNTARETNLANNVAVSAATISVDIPVLVLGQPVTNQLSTGTAQYYKVNVPPGETVRVVLTGASSNSFNELFVRYGAVPDLGNYDFLYSALFSPNQQIVIPTTQAGWYYIMVRRGNEPGGPLAYSLEADIVAFGITSVSQNHIGDNGQVTITLSGAKFHPGATVQLVSGTNIYSSTTNLFMDPTSIKARFVFTNAVHGAYDLVLTNSNAQSTTAAQAINIETALPLNARVSSALVDRQPRVGLPFRWTGKVNNSGNTDISYLTLGVVLTPAWPITLTPPADAIAAETNSTDNAANLCSFMMRDLPPGVAADFSFLISGYGNSSFSYRILTRSESKQEFLQYMVNRGETLRNFIRANESANIITNLAFIPPQLAAMLANSDSWESLYAQAFVYRGIVDSNDVTSLPAPFMAASPLPLLQSIAATPQKKDSCHSACDYAKQFIQNLQNLDEANSAANCAKESFGCVDFEPLCFAACYAWEKWGAQAQLLDKLLELLNDMCNQACDDPPIEVSCEDGDLVIVVPSIPFVYTISGVCPRLPRDPNEMLGPAGYSAAAFVGSQVPWQYSVFFENTSNALAFARQITITNILDPSFDVRTFRVSEIVFGNVTITLPANRSFYQTRVAAPYPNTTNVVVDVTAGIDVKQGVVVVTLNAIDLKTGQLVQSADQGVLPPNNTAHIGEGHITYTIKPKSSVPTGTVITNHAAIVFDINDPINTNPTTNTVDAVPPTSSISALPMAVLTTNFAVSWFGSDDVGGAGLGGYDIYVSDNGGPWQPWQTAVSGIRATYSGQPGHSYYFYSRARDNAGNLEPTPTSYQAVTLVSTNQAPILPPIPDKSVIVGSGVVLTNVASDLSGRSNLTFTLQNAPAGASINPTNGYFSWNPDCAQGSTTNLITIWATDNGTPPLSNSVTFATVVSECLQVSIGSTVMQIGTTSSVPVNLLSTVALTNLSFTLSYSTDRFNNWTATSSNAAVARFAAQKLDPTNAFFRLDTINGQVLQGPALAGRVGFSATSNSSAFVPLTIGNVHGTKLDGTPVGQTFGIGGRVVVIGNQPLLEAFLRTNAQRVLRVYGNPGEAYQVNLSTNLAATNWLFAWRLAQTNLVQDYYPNQQSPASFYRALKLSADPPIIELNSISSTNITLLLYGISGTNYVLQATTNLSLTNAWFSVTNFTLPNSFRFMETGSPTNRAIFYRGDRP